MSPVPVMTPFPARREQWTHEDLLHLMHDAYSATEDSVPVPFERWIMDGGPAMLPQETRALRDAYDDAGEERDALHAATLFGATIPLTNGTA